MMIFRRYVGLPVGILKHFKAQSEVQRLALLLASAAGKLEDSGRFHKWGDPQKWLIWLVYDDLCLLLFIYVYFMEPPNLKYG